MINRKELLALDERSSASFLKAASKMLKIVVSCEPIAASDRSAYARNVDELNFCEDVCERIQRMAFAYVFCHWA
jgi:hypothetical protein